MLRLTKRVRIAGFVLFLAPAACTSGEEKRPSESIGPEGGTVTGDGANVVVPAGALSADTPIGVAAVDDGYPALPADVEARGDVYAFTPHGQTFAEAVTVTVPFGGAASADLELWTAPPEGEWTTVEAAVVEGAAMEADVDHFSFFVVVVPVGGTGPLDGEWRIDEFVCDGVSSGPVSGVTWTIAGATGQIHSEWDTGSCTVNLSLGYPAADRFDWTIASHDCPCEGDTCPCQPARADCGVGDLHDPTWVLDEPTLTLTEEETPASEWSCQSGYEVSTLTRL